MDLEISLFSEYESALSPLLYKKKKDLKSQHFKITQEQMGSTRSEMAEKSWKPSGPTVVSEHSVTVKSLPVSTNNKQVSKIFKKWIINEMKISKGVCFMIGEYFTQLS